MEKELNKLKINYEGVSRGLNFISSLDKEFKTMTEFSCEENLAELFVLENSSYKKKTVDKLVFTNDVTQFYLNFLKNTFFGQFKWYKKMLQSIRDVLEIEFHVKSESFIDKLSLDLTRIFLMSSECMNHYDFDIVFNLTVEMLGVIGFDKNISFDFTKAFFRALGANDFDIKFSSEYRLRNLQNVIMNYLAFWQNKETFVAAKLLVDFKYPELFKKLDNFTDIVIDFSCLEKESKELRECIFGIFYTKVLLNQYCFQTVLMSYFKYYYAGDFIGTKSILFSSNILEHHLY